MGNSITASSGADTTTTTFEWSPPSPVETHDLFDAVVISANQLELRPRSELAKYLLHIWIHGEARRALHSRGPIKDSSGKMLRYGSGITALSFTFETSPMISSGDDPYFTGMTISNEEQEACRKLVDEMRAANRPKYRTTRRRRAR